MRGVVPIFRHRRVTAAVCEKGVVFLVRESLWAEQTSAKDVTQKKRGKPIVVVLGGVLLFLLSYSGGNGGTDDERERERERQKKEEEVQDGAFRKGTKKSRSRFPVGLVKRRQGIGFFFKYNFI